MITVPPYLNPGDTIAITCPAGFMAYEKAAACIHALENAGFKVIPGETLGSSSENYFSAPDAKRLEELQHFLDDKEVDAILFGRGGYGTSRIIDQLKFRKFKKRPKWIAGFSDITILHTHLLNKLGIASIHGPMAAAFNEHNNENIYTGSLLNALTGVKASYEVAPHPLNRTGIAEGQVIGGNLALLSHAIGTDSDFKTKDRIFFIEDIGECLYNIDRMLVHLVRAGKFKKPAAVLFGGFTDMRDTDRPFGTDIYGILSEKIAALECPVVFDFPVSHGKMNLALKQGMEYRLFVTKEGVKLMEN